MESDQYHVMPQQKHIGSRTHKDVKAGKIIRIDDDGFENFSDYWTDPDTPQSPSSVHILKHSLHADDRKNQTESLLAQEHESSATLSPFTPSQDEFINLELNSKSGISTALCRQPSDAKSQTVHSAELEVVETVTKEQSLTADNSDKIKTITGNEHPVESDDITVTVEVPRMVTKHKSKIAVWMKGARAKTVEKDGDESDATKRSKSSDVAATSSCKRRVAISQDPLAEEATKDKSRHGSEKCPEQPIMGSKAVINPVVVLHALSPRCSVVPGTASLTCASFPLNMKGDVAGTLSRPTTGLPSAAVGQTSPEIVRPTRKRLTYSTESPESSEIVERTQQSDFVRLEVNGIASSRLSSTDKRNETAVMSLQSLKVAETGNTEPEVSQNCKAICEEFPVVTRERKSNCRTAMNPKHITSSYSSSCVTNVVASVGRSLPLQRAKDTSQSKAFSVEAEEVFHKDDEKQIPAEKEIEVDSLQDSETDTEADNEVIRNGDCFDLFDKTSSSLAPVLDIVREDDDLVADGNDENLISLASRTREGQEGDHSDADDGNDDDADDDDFQMVPLSQVNTIKLNYNVRDIKVGSKKLTKAAKPKARSNLAGAVYNCNLPDTVDASEHTLVEEQNESPTVLERPDGIKSRTRHISNSNANKLSKVRKEGFVQNVRNNKTSSETTRKQDEAVSVDMAKNIVKNRPKAGNGYKRMKESQPPDILRKRRKRTRSSNCYVSEQEDEDLSSEKVNRHSSRTVLSQSIGETEEEDMPDALILTKESRKSVIPLERERRPVEETKEKKEDQKTPGRKTNTVKKVVDTDQKRESIPSSENNIKEGLTDAFKKNKRTKGKNKRIVKPQIVPERKGKQSKGKRTEKPTALDPVSINELVTGSDYSRKKDKAVLKEDQARDSEHLMITRGQTSMEATDGTIVSDPRQRSMLDDVSNIEPAKTHIGRNLVQYISTPKTKRRSSRHAAAVANQESSLLLHKGKRKKISSVSRQSLVGKQTERQPSAHTEDDLPDAQNSSDLSSDDSPSKRKLRKSRMLPEEPLVVTIPNGIEDKEAARINQLNVTKTPPIRLSVPSRLHYFDGTISSKKTGKQKLRKIYPPEGNNACGMRRSRRTRVKALDWFRNERIHYERRESGFVVAGIYSPKIESDLGVDEKFVKKMNCKEKHPEKKRLAERRNLSIHADLSHSLLPKTPSEIKVVNPQTQEEVFVDCVKTLDQAKMVGVSGKAPNEDEPLLLCKPIRQKTFASGTLIIRPLQIKKMQFVQNDTMLFHVIHGKVEVTIHQTNFVVESRDKFFVPVGNSYSIRNLRNEDAELDFTQIKS